MGHDRGRAHNRRHVQVVSASVHHRNIVPGIILSAHLAGVRKAGLFLHRKRVEFGAQHDCRPGSILENSHDSCAAHVFRHVIAQAAKALGQSRCSLSLMPGEFRMLMQIQIQRVRIRIDSIHLLGSWRRLSPRPGSEEGNQQKLERSHVRRIIAAPNASGQTVSFWFFPRQTSGKRRTRRVALSIPALPSSNRVYNFLEGTGLRDFVSKPRCS